MSPSTHPRRVHTGVPQGCPSGVPPGAGAPGPPPTDVARNSRLLCGDPVASGRGQRARGEGCPRHRRLGWHRRRVRTALRRRGRPGRRPLPPWRASAAEALAAEIGAAATVAGRPHVGGRRRPAVRGGPPRARLDRRVCRRRRGVAVDGRARLGDEPEPVGGDAAAESDGDVPHGARRSCTRSHATDTDRSFSSARRPGRFGEAGHADYAAAKSAIQVGLLLSLKNEVARIAPHARVNAVAPGWTESPMTRGLVDDEAVRRISRTMALRKVAQPEDVAAQVVALASDTISGHVTGQVVTVAGGMEGRVGARRRRPHDERRQRPGENEKGGDQLAAPSLPSARDDCRQSPT